MKKLIYDIINKIKTQNVTYADVRFTNTDQQTIYFEKGVLKHFGSNLDSKALGIRVLADGCWGFAGTTVLTNDSIDKTIKKAISNAKLGSRFRLEPAAFKKLPPVKDSYFFQPEEDPFLMDDKFKIDFHEQIAKKLVGNEKIVFSNVYTEFYRQYKVYANTEGTMVDSLVYDTMPMMYVLASNGHETMCRTHPGHMNGRRGGFEIVRNVKLLENTDKLIEEAIQLLDAPRIEEERADIIIGGGHLALQLHESAGHATEADRIFGKEISYAGKTFIKPKMLGNFRYGSDLVNIYSDSRNEGGMGFHIVDDEGTPGATVDIVKNGILLDQQTSQETAALLGVKPSSNMLASYADDIPLIRMTNFCLAPGKGSLEDLIKSTENGYYIDFTKTWSIDDNRNNFQFTTEIGWKIENGEIKHIVKEPTYYGITPEFWGACNGICGEEEWEFHGTFHCGKGEPGQAMHLSHGVAPARFKNIVW
ncbi:MAG: TldD/PmbA family protein [Candidatus Cloacimonetes bacterium]|nr:TldD/PmbA family protein [Candidatus Cloacimonadota bacterium]MCF7813079.1 TldD/PmbA family protein [Candidatus Cloacimonadota bacterium]MCF7867180.1 TldD/PmbA family protein [Candidatus Cloacimonadota bacterium]MCF7882624.1 TldD/PmbA family protein [Candidatus Cloacimonadota bacterium]